MIHDICYDWNGERFATSSSDKTVKIWKKDNSQ
jgi:WD40 repeat protein